MTDTERINWLVKVNAMIWNDANDGAVEKRGFTVCVPETWMGKRTGHNEVEAKHKYLRKAIDQARKWMEE